MDLVVIMVVVHIPITLPADTTDQSPGLELLCEGDIVATEALIVAPGSLGALRMAA